MDLMHLILVLSVFIPTVVYSRPNNDDDELNSQSEELDLQSRAIVLVTPQCNWITYDLDRSKRVYKDVKPYQCALLTLVKGICVLSWSDGVFLCNNDPTCGGFMITTNRIWNSGNNKGNQISVNLYSKTAKPLAKDNTNKEWYSFPKKCWQLNT